MLTSYFDGGIWRGRKGERHFYYVILFLLLRSASNTLNDGLKIEMIWWSWMVRKAKVMSYSCHISVWRVASWGKDRWSPRSTKCEVAAKWGVTELRILRTLCPSKCSLPIFFPSASPYCLTPTTLLIKIFFKKHVKENRTFQGRCQNCWMRYRGSMRPQWRKVIKALFRS